MEASYVFGGCQWFGLGTTVYNYTIFLLGITEKGVTFVVTRKQAGTLFRQNSDGKTAGHHGIFELEHFFFAHFRRAGTLW